MKGLFLAMAKVMSLAGVNLLKELEGCKNMPYKDSAGLPTVGIGHLITSSDKFTYPLTNEKIMEIFRKDIKRFENSVNSAVKTTINQNQFEALVCFCYNIGEGAFAQSTLLKLINLSKFTEAAEQFGRWKYAGGQVIKGLSIRRDKEKTLFLRK